MSAPDLPFLAGNWKMNTDRDGARRLAQEIGDLIGRSARAEIGLFPPFPFLGEVGEVAKRHGYSFGGQNLHDQHEGAFTGEVSGRMLASLGCVYVIVGHSERRQLFGETDEVVARKVRAALAAGLSPIVCIGETRADREGGRTETVIRRQARVALEAVTPQEFARITLAYEPVWAIGTGLTATPDQAQAAHAAVRTLLVELFGERAARACRILYGGSVKPENIEDLMARDEIQGALVGGASLSAASFAGIVRGAVSAA